MKDASPTQIQFRVAGAVLDDVGRDLARLNREDLERLSAVPGDVLLVTGRWATVARAAQATPRHRGQRLIQVDGNTRDKT